MWKQTLPLLAGCCLLSSVAFCNTYNAVTDFNLSGTQMPGAVWTYGTTANLNGAFTLLPNFGMVNCTGPAAAYPNNCNPAGATWANYFGPANAFGPSVGNNLSAGAITYLAGTSGTGINVNWPNNVLAMAPGGSLRSYFPDFIVVRFTNPVGGSYNIAGAFSNLQAATVNLYVSIQGTPYAESFGSPFSFSDVSLPAGGIVDFIVDSQGEQSFDIVGLSATIVTPEPNSGILLVCALGALALARRRVVASRS